jgi:spore coat-associated protein N
MRKILALSVAALLVMGLVGGGTWAYFSDTETGSGTFAAGTLDLTANGSNANVTLFTLTDIAPGDDDGDSSIPTVALKNIGSVTSDLWVSMGTITNTQSANGTGEHTQVGTGELGGYVKMAIWIDSNGDDSFNNGVDKWLTSDNGTDTALNPGDQFDYIDNYDTASWDTCWEDLTQGDEVELHVEWEFTESDSDQNDAQGDSVSVGFNFELYQADYTP